MVIKLYNTLVKKKQIFTPIKEGEVKLYTCGPTVYYFAHIGNLRAYVFADTLKRTLIYNGYKVNQVMNITDVGHLSDDADQGQDKMLKGAEREGKTVWEIARFYEKAFKKDIKALNIMEPEKYCRATEHIAEMIEMNKLLEKNGYTYFAGGNLYFDTSKFERYWDLIGTKQDVENQEGRVEKDPNKKHPFDFVLWFTQHKYEKHAMEWDSPWGKGFPGWHIECSAMSTKYLGDKIDIHTGGIDHVPIHHTNEIAQNDCAYGHQVVNNWIHNEWLIIKDEKMSKSEGNILTLDALKEKGYDPMDFRYFLLLAQYRKKLNFSFEALDSAKSARLKLVNRILLLKKEKNHEIQKKEFENYKKKLIEDINDDLNTPRVLAMLWEFISDEKINAHTKLQLVKEFDKVLGLKLSEAEEEKIPEKIIELKKKRDEARAEKDWKKSDSIRDEILKQGYKVFDDKEGSTVRKIK